LFEEHESNNNILNYILCNMKNNNGIMIFDGIKMHYSVYIDI